MHSSSQRILTALAVIALVFILSAVELPRPVSAPPGGWWNTNWKYRSKLTFDKITNTENLLSFPVMVNLGRLGNDFWSHVDPNHKDLRFVDADSTTELYFEIEYWNQPEKKANVWVQVPQIDAGSTTDCIYVYWGNPAASESPRHNPAQVWDSSFKMVQHLEETSGTVTDSTSNDNDGTYHGSGQGISGKIDGSDRFIAANKDYISMPHSDSLNLGTSDFTISVWVNPNNGPNSDADILRKGNTQDTIPNNYKVELTSNHIAGELYGSRIQTTDTYLDDQWHFVVFRRQAGTIYLHVDGNLKGSKTGAGTNVNNTSTFSIGSKNPPILGDYINGLIDEVRISNTARSLSWINSEFYSANDNFITYGSEENGRTIESCNLAGNKKDDFAPGDAVYVYGSGYPPSSTFNLYVVRHVDTWNDGTNILDLTIASTATVQSDSSGNIITPKAIWNTAISGKYDIIVDVNRNNKYDESVDALDNIGVYGTGFFVIPEYTLGTILALAACFTGVAVYRKAKKSRKPQ